MRTAVDLLAIYGLLMSCVLIAKYWRELPDRIAIHFGLTGKPDGWGPKATILIMPIVTASLWCLMTWTEVHSDHRTMWLVLLLKVEVIWLFTYLTWKMIQASLGKAEGLGKAFLLFAVIPVVCTVILWTVCAPK